MRADLPRGVQAANLIHAAGESSPGNLEPGTYAVALVVQDEAALWRLSDELRKHGVKFSAVVEADSPYSGQLMALGLAPQRKENVRRHLSSLPLLR